jgi:hypothetical protein
VLSIMLGAAGLAHFLIECHPSDKDFNDRAQWLW